MKSSEKKVYIYGLFDPRDGELRYIGKTVKPKTRLRGHICNARLYRDGTGHKENWIRKLLSLDLRPLLKILEECTEDNWKEIETRKITEAREQGVRLTNILDGGNQPPTWSEFKAPEVAKRKIAKANKSRPHPHIGRKWGEDYKLKMSKALSGKNNPMYGLKGKDHPATGRYVTEETRRNLSRALTGKKNPMYGKTHTEEAREKLSLSGKGRRQTEEDKQKKSLSCRMHHAEKKGRKEVILDLQEEYLELSGDYHPRYLHRGQNVD